MLVIFLKHLNQQLQSLEKNIKVMVRAEVRNSEAEIRTDINELKRILLDILKTSPPSDA